MEVFDATARNVVYVKGRRAGGTVGAVMRLIEIAHEEEISRHLWVDTVHRNIERYVDRYFKPRLKGTKYKWSRQKKMLRFQSGSYCDFGSAQRPSSLEGFGYDYIWLNEAGIILRDQSIYYETLLPMLLESKNAQIFVIGSPKGPGLFKQMFDWGQDDQMEDWVSFRHPSSVNPLLSEKELEYQREHMPEREYRQEILAEFVEGGGAVFRGMEHIVRATAEEQARSGAVYVMGVDLARYRDYTVVWVGRADLCAGVYCDRFHKLPWPSQVERIAAISRRFGGAPIYVDATGVGDPIAEDLKLGGLPVVPVVFTAATKQRLIDSLALAIEHQRLTIFAHEPTLRELSAYEHSVLPSGHSRTSAPPGGHDDCVIALALCHWARCRWTCPWPAGSAWLKSARSATTVSLLWIVSG
ncbi:MAG: hypothetical protein O7G32_11480 [SAR324 cluster bacterium]|nr:hypothetical protein [SAR324 cluster bacterium]